MENEADIVDGLHTGDTKSLGTSEERVEEEVVFEDAMKAEEDFLELRMNSDSADAVVKEEGEEQPAGDSKHGMVYDDPNSVYEVDNFEEATDGLSLTAQNREEVNDEGKPTLITTEEEVCDDGGPVLEPMATCLVDEEGSEEKVKSEFNELPNGSSSHEEGVEEFSEVGAANEGEILDEDETDHVKSSVTTSESGVDAVNEKLEEPASLDETGNSIGACKKKEDDCYTHQVTESNREILDENEVKEEKGTLDRDDETTWELRNTNGGHQVAILDNKSEKPNDDRNLINADAKFADKGSGELEDYSTASPKSRSENEEGEDLSYSSIRKEHMDYNVKEVNNASVVVDSGDIGDKSDTSTANLECNGLTTAELKNNSADLPKNVDITEVEFQNGTLSPVNVNNEKTVKIQDVKTGLIAMGNHDDKSQQLDDHDKSSISVEKIEKAEGNVQEEKQGTCTITDAGVHPSPKLPFSSKKGSNPAPSPARPAGLGRAAPLLEPALRTAQQHRVNGSSSHMQSQQIEYSSNGEAEENDETREKLQMIRVKFLRLAHRLGQTPHNVVVAQVLYRLGLAEQLQGRSGGRVGAFSFDRASAMAEHLEAAGKEPLDFSCTIMVLGKTGVGKSATINSIFDEVKFGTDAFQIGTKKVQDVVGTVQGIKVRVIDTPGLLSSWSDQRQNEKILLSVKRLITKTPPDIVLYLDRMDVQNRDLSDMPLLRTITDIFGPSIWFNAIVVFTHAASAPPDGPNGTASSYDMFVTQRSHVVQQAIRQAAGDMRLMNPVSLVENHSACRTNRAGQRVLPNGQVWKPHLLLLSFASKILAEANALLKLQDSPPGRPFTARSRGPPLPFLLSTLLQSRPQVKLPEEQFSDGDDMEDELDESSDSEEESEYDELPPFERLTKAQVSELSKVQKKAYYDELEYREKLFMKKQLKEEKRRRKMMKKMASQIRDLPSDYTENLEEESNGAASVPVPMPDMPLPASFDSENPTHRYRYLDSSNQWPIRPVLETHGWDHDVGYEGINVEKLFVIKERIPLYFSGQVTKDKKDANIQMEMTSSIKHGEGKATSFGFDTQTVGKDLAYTLRGESIICNFWKNKAIAGIAATLLGDTLSGGVKVENKLIASKRFRLVVAGGAMTSRGDFAYGGCLEAQLRDREYPLGRSLSTLGLSVMDWQGDLAIGCNLQSQIPIGRSTTLIGRANLNNKGAGQVSIRLNSSEKLQIALIGFVPLVKKIFGYHQQLSFSQ